VAAPPAAGLAMAEKLASRLKPPRWLETKPAACTVMIRLALLKNVCRAENRPFFDAMLWVAALDAATSIASCGPSSTRLRKSVKYDIDSVAWPLDSGR